MAENTVTIEQLPSTISLDGTELVPIAVPNGAGGYTTQQTTTGSIAAVGVDAEFVLVSENPLLPNGRILTGASGQITIADGGPAENITVGLAASGVDAGTYGDGTHVAQVTIDALGRVTSAANVAITNEGTVTSVGLTAPSQFGVSGSPVTGSGTLALTWANENANLVLSGPASGAAGTPAFRALVGADLPFPAAATLGGVKSHSAIAHQFLTQIGTDGTVSGTQPSAADLSNGTTGTGAVVLAASPALTGSPTAPTPTTGDNSTLIATTAFVQANAPTSILAWLNSLPTTLPGTSGQWWVNGGVLSKS